LELNETHLGEEGDPQGLVLMDEPGNASVEEVANNSRKEQLALIEIGQNVTTLFATTCN
jgi:hypothetical protein